ncbi:MAG: hypothetical protein Q8N03_12885 [Ignavibacteria bacterium]|nr:hypothetical protein [Ignavibacteria bacterium]MDP3829892.1 hypothetical protein [Ignavibacteriaceae bacterium]
MPLGDNFPPALKEQQINNSISSGKVLKLFCPFTKPPKEKYLLLISINPTVCVFIINSEINLFVQSKYDLQEAQVLIKKNDYNFLDHDSYIACNEVIEYFSLEEIKKQLSQDISRIKGKITPSTRNHILISTNNCRALSKIEKRKIVESMNSIVFD